MRQFYNNIVHYYFINEKLFGELNCYDFIKCGSRQKRLANYQTYCYCSFIYIVQALFVLLYDFSMSKRINKMHK